MALPPGASNAAAKKWFTFYNYVKAWVDCLETWYGSGNEGRDNFLTKLKCMESFGRLQRKAVSLDAVAPAYHRGRLTLLAMSSLPVRIFPEIAHTANLWLPVQSYYAVHGFGLAFLACWGQFPRDDHRAFRAALSPLLSAHFPFPFRAQCNGGPQRDAFVYAGLRTCAAEVSKLSNFADPCYAPHDHFIGKSLGTTRTEILDQQYEKARSKPGAGRTSKKNLPRQDKLAICNRLHATTLCDLLFRMRLRANYDDPEMFFAARDYTEHAVTHYYDLLYLTQVLADGIEALIERRIGPELKMALDTRFGKLAQP